MPPRKTPAKKSTTRTSADDVLYCSCCGTAFPSPDKSFYKSPSPLYAKNGGYVHICKNCIRKYYDELMVSILFVVFWVCIIRKKNVRRPRKVPVRALDIWLQPIWELYPNRLRPI